jgi:CRISPR/Cas system-associated protein endoribonuclease Cas2
MFDCGGASFLIKVSSQAPRVAVWSVFTTSFRNYLLDGGYQMMQFSVYARACLTFARQETHIDRLKKIFRRKIVCAPFS